MIPPGLLAHPASNLGDPSSSGTVSLSTLPTCQRETPRCRAASTPSLLLVFNPLRSRHRDCPHLWIDIGLRKMGIHALRLERISGVSVTRHQRRDCKLRLVELGEDQPEASPARRPSWSQRQGGRGRPKRIIEPPSAHKPLRQVTGHLDVCAVGR